MNDNVSTDGSDTAGSLCDFIVDDDAEIESVSSASALGMAEELVLPPSPSSSGLRRSRRRRRAPQRYVDENFAQIFMEDATAEEIQEIFSSEIAGTDVGAMELSDESEAQHNEDDDEDYNPEDDDDDDDDEEYEEEEYNEDDNEFEFGL